jgi:DNA invertase Pin-like site-specific DNA recombinase
MKARAMPKTGKLIILLCGKPKMKGIAAYLRVSTDKQDSSHQRASIITYAATLGYDEKDLIFYTDDGVTGASHGLAKRPNYKRLLSDIVQGKVAKVLVFEASRTSRDFFDYLDFLRLCRDNGTKLDIVGKGEVQFERSEDLLMASIHAFLSQAEREKISERTKSGLRRAKLSGQILGPPKGNVNRQGKTKDYDPKLIRQVLSLTKKGLSLRTVADMVTSDTNPITYQVVSRIIKRHA